MSLISTLEEREANFVFAGRATHSSDEFEVRDTGLDVVAATLLLARTFDYNTVFNMFDIEHVIWQPRWRSVKFQTALQNEIEEDLSELHAFQFALLWTPPGVWEPQLVHSASWDDDRVRDELFRSVRTGLGCIHEDRVQMSGISILRMDALTNGNLVKRQWDECRAEEMRQVLKEHFRHICEEHYQTGSDSEAT